MAPSKASAPAPAALPPPPPAAAEWVVVGGFPDDTSLALMRLDTTTGALSRVSTTSVGGVAPAYAAWQRPAAAPAGAAQQTNASPCMLYVTNHARNRPGTGLTAVRWQAAGSSSGGDAAPSLVAAGSGSFAPVPDPAHAAVAPSGRWVLTASYDGCSLSVVPVLEGGRLGQAATLEEAAVGKAPHEVGAGQEGGAAASCTLGPCTCFVQMWSSQPAAAAMHRQAVPASFLQHPLIGCPAYCPFLPSPTMQVVFDPSGRFVYVPCLGSDWVRCFSFEDATGTLSPLSQPGGDSRVRLPPGSGPRHLAFHPSLPVAYTFNELGNSIAKLDWDAASGTLSFPAGTAQQAQRVVSTLPPGTPPGVPIRQAARGGPVQVSWCGAGWLGKRRERVAGGACRLADGECRLGARLAPHRTSHPHSALHPSPPACRTDWVLPLHPRACSPFPAGGRRAGALSGWTLPLRQQPRQPGRAQQHRGVWSVPVQRPPGAAGLGNRRRGGGLPPTHVPGCRWLPDAGASGFVFGWAAGDRAA